MSGRLKPSCPWRLSLMGLSLVVRHKREYAWAIELLVDAREDARRTLKTYGSSELPFPKPQNMARDHVAVTDYYRAMPTIGIYPSEGNLRY